MPGSVVLTDLAYATPDGRALFSHLDLTFASERTGLVGRNGVGKTTLLRLILRELTPSAGTIAAPPRVVMLRQIVQHDPDATPADLFGVRDALALLARAERGDASADELARADWEVEARMGAALARVKLDATANTQLGVLSGGQRTRAGLAALVFDEPDFLLLDEPTNNLDAEGRAAVASMLRTWRGGAIVVSHDRGLLEEMDAIVELTTIGAQRFGGGYSAYRARKDVELEAAEHDLAHADKRVDLLARKEQDAKERKARKDRAGKANGLRGDMPKIMLGGMKENAENTGAEMTRLAERRKGEAMDAAAAARKRIEILQTLAPSFAKTHLAANKVVVRADGLRFGYEAGKPIIEDLSFMIAGPERVAMSGANGSGKTTLLKLITGALQPWSGTVRVMTEYALFDQAVSLLDARTSVLDNFKRINPNADENTCRAALARFMFRADDALKIASELSGGQMLRAALACVLGGERPPPLLILDEPTNHLDLDSIAAIEGALAAYDGALLTVSHDEAFLATIGVTRRIAL